MLVCLLREDFVFEDERGKLAQLVHDGYKQINVIFSRKGAKRGGHFHKENAEAFYIVSGGCFLRASYKGEKEEHFFKEGDMFRVERNVWHSFEFTQDTLLVSMYDKGVELPDGRLDINE